MVENYFQCKYLKFKIGLKDKIKFQELLALPNRIGATNRKNNVPCQDVLSEDLKINSSLYASSFFWLCLVLKNIYARR